MGKKSGLVAICDRGADGAPVIDEAEGESFALLQPCVSIVLGDSERDAGTLYVTTRRIIWLSDEHVTKGYAVDFLSLSMHAISRDPEAYPSPCIYTQIENGDDEYDEGDEQDAAVGNGHLDLSKVKEMRLVPGDPNLLDSIFQVLCECATLNPDPEGEQEGEGEWYFNAEEVLGGHNDEENAGGESHDEVDDPRFQDAEEEGEE